MIGIWLVGYVLLVSLATLGVAGTYCIRPSEATLAAMRPLSLSIVFAALCSTSVGVATALKNGAEARLSPDGTVLMIAGLAESVVPLVVAFGVLAVSWLLIAAGLRRQA